VNGAKAHSTQKPEALLYRILLASTNPGDVVLDPFFGTGTTGAVAKKLNRAYLGIERDPEYVRLAKERLASIQPAPANALALPDKRRQPRIPFGALLEAGLLTPGQVLTFSRSPDKQALILADGHLRCGNTTGSIHSLARHLLSGVPANGWDLWLYAIDGGEFRPIDTLREALRAQQTQEEHLEA
jgi:modification methylase